MSFHIALKGTIDESGIRHRPLLDQTAVIRITTSPGPNAETKFDVSLS